MREDHHTTRVAVASIQRRLRDNGHDGVFLEFRPDRDGGTGEGVRAVVAAVEHANAAAPAETVWGQSLSASPTGWLVKLDSIGTWDQTQQWLASFAEHLDNAGYSGELLAAAQVWLPSWLQANRTPRLTAHLACRLSRPFVQGNVDTRGPAAWDVDSEATAVVCAAAVGWAAPAGAPVLFSEGRSQTLLRGDGLAAQLSRAVTRTAAAGVTFAQRSPLLARRVQLGAWGQLIYQLEAPERSWRERLDELRAVLVAHAALVELAMIRLSPNWALDWTDLAGATPPLPYVSEGRVRNNRQLWAEHTPDAYGVQVLTERHLARANDLDGWDVSAVAPDRYLVQARDLAPWYAGAEPDAEVVEQARRDFGAAILTPEAIAASG